MKHLWLYGIAGIALAGGVSAAAPGDRPEVQPPLERGPVLTRYTQQDPRYQVSVEHMSRVSQLLRRALEESAASQKAFPVPGFAYDALQGDLQAVLEGIEPLLIPEKRRLRYQTLVPDGAYFRHPSTVQENPDVRQQQ